LPSRINSNTTLNNLMKLIFLSASATVLINPLSLHDALPICLSSKVAVATALTLVVSTLTAYAGVKALDTDSEKLFYSLGASRWQDRKSTRLNSSHRTISYAVFCLKKKKIPAHLYELQQEKSK